MSHGDSSSLKPPSVEVGSPKVTTFNNLQYSVLHHRTLAISEAAVAGYIERRCDATNYGTIYSQHHAIHVASTASASPLLSPSMIVADRPEGGNDMSPQPSPTAAPSSPRNEDRRASEPVPLSNKSSATAALVNRLAVPKISTSTLRRRGSTDASFVKAMPLKSPRVGSVAASRLKEERTREEAAAEAARKEEEKEAEKKQARSRSMCSSIGGFGAPPSSAALQHKTHAYAYAFLRDRHYRRAIDAMLKGGEADSNEQYQIVHVGCGFDWTMLDLVASPSSPAGLTCIDIDETPVMERREAIYNDVPASAAYKRVSVPTLDDLVDSITSCLSGVNAPPAGGQATPPPHTLIILDGVLECMSPEAGDNLLAKISAVFDTLVANNDAFNAQSAHTQNGSSADADPNAALRSMLAGVGAQAATAAKPARVLHTSVVGWEGVYPQDTYGGIVTAVSEQAKRPRRGLQQYPTVGSVTDRLQRYFARCEPKALSAYSALSSLLHDSAEMDRLTTALPLNDWEDLTESLLHAVTFAVSPRSPDAASENGTSACHDECVVSAGGTTSPQASSKLAFLRKLGDFCLGIHYTVVECQSFTVAKATAKAAFILGEGGLVIVDLRFPKLHRSHPAPSGDVPTERIYHASAMLTKDSMVTYGGVQCVAAADGVPLPLCDSAVHVLDVHTLVWRALPFEDGTVGPGLRQRHCLASLMDSKVLLFGGYRGGATLGDTWILEAGGGETGDLARWVEVPCESAAPPARHSGTLTPYGKHGLMLHAGMGEKALLNDTWLFDADTRVWREVVFTGWKPSPRMSHGAAWSDEAKTALLVIGGSSLQERTGGVGDTDSYLTIIDVKDDEVRGYYKHVVIDSLTECGAGNSMLLTRHFLVQFQPRTFLVMGGGSHCNTYGTFLNKPRVAYLDAYSASGKAFSAAGKQCERVPLQHNPTTAQWNYVYSKRQPCAFRAYYGECVSKWTTEYLQSTIGSKEASVGVCGSPQLTFHPRNYEFKVTTFQELFESTLLQQKQDEWMYYRSVGKNMRKDPADFWATQPELADDFHAPEFLKETLAQSGGAFSSALRVSSKDVIIWCHYDTVDGMLFQVSGTKHVLLFPPDEIGNLYIEGSSSLAGDVTSCDLKKYPLVNKAMAKGRHVVLQPGDALFIPALWFHTTWAQDPSVSVNIMWKHLEPKHYERNDLYGNKDVVEATEALKAMNKVHDLLEKVCVALYLTVATFNPTPNYRSPTTTRISTPACLSAA